MKLNMCYAVAKRMILGKIRVRCIDRIPEKEDATKVLLQISCVVIFGPLKRYIQRNILFQRDF